MFSTIKQQVNLLEEMEKDLGLTFKKIGDKNWGLDSEQDGCPFCGHKDCFRISYVPGDNTSSFYKCFSCGEYGDVITWKHKRFNLEMADAAKKLAQDHDIKLPHDFNPIQQVFNLAALYYHTHLKEEMAKPLPMLGGITPLEYQLTIRKHKPESIDRFKVGFSDGGLVDYLQGVGISDDVIIESGLGRRPKESNGLRDFLPKHCFIYPHYVKGKVSHFTFKDPLKKLAFQLPKKYSLNGYLFYGQETIGEADLIILVEGENDRISVMESGKVPTCLATIGQISTEQLEWLRTNGKGYRVITIFDPDAAGNKYREKVEMLRRYFKNLVHVKPPEDRDIDDLLVNGGDIMQIIKDNIVKVEPENKSRTAALDAIWGDIAPDPNRGAQEKPVEGQEGASEPDSIPWGPSGPVVQSFPVAEALNQGYVPPAIPGSFNQPAIADTSDEVVSLNDSNVFQKKGCYWRLRFKDGQPEEVCISNFTIELLAVYQKEDGDREREVVIRRFDGYRSKPFMVDSETKVSLKSFKVLIAKMADCTWTGRDAELDSMWNLVYEKGHDSLIEVPHRVGYHSGHRCWIFKNALVTGVGSVIQPDENGVFWISGKTLGIKPEGISEGGDNTSIPILETSLSREEAKQLMAGVIEHFSNNLGSMGSALLALGWIYSNVYSDLIFKTNRGMSILFLWSLYGEGKTTLVSWLRYFFGFLDNTGRTTITQLKSAVGFQRQGEYYASVPLFLDELRQDEESNRHLGMIRSWYDRDGRTMGTRDAHSVRSQKVRSTLIVAGEDLPSDPATRERCVSIRVPKGGREKVESFRWFQKQGTMLSNITYYWIQDACLEDPSVLLNGMTEIDSILRSAGCSSRTSKNWSAAGFLGNKLAKEFCPEFDFISFLKKESVAEYVQQKEDSTLNSFFEDVEAIMSMENSPITNHHIMTEGNKVHIWFNPVHRIVTRESRKSWSKSMIQRALREETYFISDDKKVRMGLDGTRQVVITLDLREAPDVIKNIAKAND